MVKKGLSPYLSRFALLLVAVLLIAGTAMFALSNYVSGTAFSGTNHEELESALRQADEQLARYRAGELTRAELIAIVNPTLNTGGVFWMLVGEDGAVVAYTEEAAPYFVRAKLLKYLPQLDQGLSILSPEGNASGMTLILGERTENGYIFVGKPTRAYYGAAYNFRVTLFSWLLPVLLLLSFLCLAAMRVMARPAVILANLASRMAEGDFVRLDEDQPGEVGDLALAFNKMSETISGNMIALNTEKETMRRILEGLSEGILAIDADGAIIHENAAAVRLLGDAESDAYRRVMEGLKASLSSPEDRSDKLARGEAILSYSITHLPTEGKRGGVVALIRDVTEQERLERTRHDYVANISHELRTPLANMRGLAEGLRDGLVTEQADRVRYYGMIVDEIKRLSRLVNDLLELSGLQSNSAAFETEKVEPTELMWELYDLNRHLFEGKKQTFTLQIPQEDMPTLVTNEDRLSQVLTIFMDNARKYTGEGGSVTLGAQVLENGVRFFVRDTGIGMSEETMRLAFDRFHQAERSHADKGSGLGLSIAKEILQKLGVTIKIESELGKGSEFSFVLPR